MKKSETEAYRNGYAAYRVSSDRLDTWGNERNPYDITEQNVSWVLWCEGWCDARDNKPAPTAYEE